jgi:hypothetical protein
MPYNAFKKDIPLILERLRGQQQPIRTADLVLCFRTVTGWKENTAQSYIKMLEELGYLKKTINNYKLDCYFLAPDLSSPNIFPKEKEYFDKQVSDIKKAKQIKE